MCEEEEEKGFTRYIRGNGRLVASDSESARTYYHYACDSLGSVDYVIAGNEFGCDGDKVGIDQRVLCRYGYDAFGNTVDAFENVGNRYGFTGEMRDDVTGMYYLRARYYSSGIGRFTQTDTYHGDGLNLYVYAGNNPVRYVDPSGHCCKDSGVDSGNRQLLNGEEWYQYFRETYGTENVQGSAYNLSSIELQTAVDSIHAAGYGGKAGGKFQNYGERNPITITVLQNGKVIVSKNRSTINELSIKKAYEIFGKENVDVVSGYGKNYISTETLSDDSPVKNNHSEVRGIQETKNKYGTAQGAKQFCSHYSCQSCMEVQKREGVMNYTGYEVEFGKITRQYNTPLY